MKSIAFSNAGGYKTRVLNCKVNFPGGRLINCQKGQKNPFASNYPNGGNARKSKQTDNRTKIRGWLPIRKKNYYPPIPKLPTGKLVLNVFQI